ncbi:hypothetical protein EJB05_05336 [Eragrostis curvula]|uniref:TATA-box-binding protein n=2 Tax=Poaceae TaxID=4479 RepID=A0A5J9WCV3_9POAL|nr:hypothetical protein EJB05_05336 [Eragrostis curvula]
MAEAGLEGSQPVDLSKHPSGIIPTLQNIVSTVNLDCKLDLKAIALQARNAEYNPKRFAAVIMRIREPKTTALIFASGKMVCTGAKSEQQSKLAARKVLQLNTVLLKLNHYARIIQKLGFPAKFKDFKIQNIVGSCDVKFPIRLEGLAYSHGAFSSYEPELFPGLIYRMKQPKIVLLIFVSGKIVLTGAKVREETYTAFENIYPVLTEFRKVQQWNIVSTVNLDCKLDLKAIALQARNAEYNPKRFAAVIMRIREPKTTALIFASGKMVCTGAKSEQQSKLAARKYARIIQKLGFPAKFKDFKIQNIVGSCDVKFPIRLEGLAYSHGAFSSYEPELFPGLIYRMKQPKIVLLIFVSGKIVLTGAKVREETYTAFENIYPVLTEFRKVQQCLFNDIRLSGGHMLLIRSSRFFCCMTVNCNCT